MLTAITSGIFPPQLPCFSTKQRVPLCPTPTHLSRSKCSLGSFPIQSTTTPWKGQSNKVIMAVKSNEESRPLANFHPNIWGDRFLLSDLEYDQLIKDEKEKSLKVGALIQELKIELKEVDQRSVEQLKLIDAIQRLGVEYHFEGEIDRALQDIYENFLDFHKSNNDLYSNALSFRLLRQHGHKVSCDIFEKFKDVNGEFKISITSDVMGMLEFYEATYLSIQGEDVLDHGRAFTRAHLHSILPNIGNSSIGKQVSLALDYSNRRGLPRIETRKYISVYEQHGWRHENLLQLAKLDFNLLQSLHQRELNDLYSWWKGLDVPKNLWYARDRCVETYLCALTVYFEPQYTVARKYLSKIMPLLTILDDTYDAYGTLEELQTLTEAFERWDIPCSGSLNGCMEVLYKAIWEVVEEIKDDMVNLGAEYRASYGKEAIKNLARAYLEQQQYIPKTTDEYMTIGTKANGFMSTVIFSYIGMGDIATNDAFNWVVTSPPMFNATNIVCKLGNDLAGHEFEKEREHIPSALEHYMEEHGVSQHETIHELNKRIEIAWKDINKGLLIPTEIPTPLLHRILNISRILESMYREGDWYTHVGPEMQNYIKQLFIDPIPE